MVYWVNRHHRLAESIKSLLFTQDEQETYGTMMNLEPDRETTEKNLLSLKEVLNGNRGRKG
jgi:hypothetical protein